MDRITDKESWGGEGGGGGGVWGLWGIIITIDDGIFAMSFVYHIPILLLEYNFAFPLNVVYNSCLVVR